MGKGIVQKILEAHLGEGRLVVGQEIGLRIDQTLTQDATGTMTYLQFEAMGLNAIETELSVSYIDHNTTQVGFENADDHAYLQTVAARYGIVFSRPGNGICHQVHLERFGRPGTTLLGSDSHTPTGGGIGQLAIGAGGLDVAVAMGGGLFYLTAPRVCRVDLTGELKGWVSAKDVVLRLLEAFSTKGNVGLILEYGGPGVAHLTVPERATITNMGAEMGVTTSIFPSDQETKKFLVAQGRENDWVELLADADAVYERVVELNLADVRPMAACPHSPGDVREIAELRGLPVDQVCIGSCTNSSYKDLATVALMLRGRKVHPRVSLGIAPGSRQVLAMLAHDGHLADLVDAGARILESACGFCVGNSFSPKSGSVSVRTNNRNFQGRSGTKDARVYLTSPAVAAAAALVGEITDPEVLGDPPHVTMPEQYTVDDGMFIFPDQALRETQIQRGPNIGAPPTSHQMPRGLHARTMIKVGDKVTTDDIMPAGPRLKYRSNVRKYAEFVFEHVDATFAKRCLDNKDKGGQNVIVAGESYGQGSSREHAALCPMYLGVKAVIAKSFERIHAANLVNFGIVPLVFESEQDYENIERDDMLEMDNWREAVESAAIMTIRNTTKGVTIRCTANLTGRQRDIALAGGLLNYTNSRS